jgi:uncharacterized membrane protein YsdA (DUF1294 family)
MYAVFYYLLVNLICFALFTWDKVAARRHRSRIAETTLHLWTILGGAVGALCARQIFRHKTQKALFTLIIWVSLILHSLIIIAICTHFFDTSPYFRY